VSEAQKETAEIAGFTLVDAESVLITHLAEVLKSHAAELLTRQDVQLLVEQVKRVNQAVVDELIPHVLSLGDLQKVLQGLLAEQVPIRDLVLILEALADSARQAKSIEELIEAARRRLSRSIVRQYLGDDGKLHVLTLDANLEAFLGRVFTGEEVLSPERFRKILGGLSRKMEQMASLGHFPILLVPGKMRRNIRNLFSGSLPQLVVLAFEEIPRDVEVRVEGVVKEEE